jgi:dihydrolipoamide dehydrogenase
MDLQKDIAIIGGGPGGYVAALRAAQLKKSVVLFEEDAVGGTCMNYGCIPTKHLLHQTKVLREVRTSRTLTGPVREVGLDWAKVLADKRKVVDRLVRGVEFLLEKTGVELVRGTAILRDERRVVVRTRTGEERVYAADKIILAAGSRPAELPTLKIDGRDVLSSTETLELEAPPKSLLVVGAGAIGVEMATIYHRLGTEVNVLELMPGVLPGCDRELGSRLEFILKKQGLKVQTQMRIESCIRGDGRVVLRGTNLKTGAPFELSAEKVLLAAGRKARSEGLQEGTPFLALTRQGCLVVDERLETNVPGIYAIGDLVGGKLLAHKASHEGLAAAENAAGGRIAVDHRALPMAVFTEPEFASVGLTEEEAKAGSGDVQTGIFSFQANGRALTMDSPDGLVKIVSGPDGRILGGHILGPCASELIAEVTLAMSQGLKASDVAAAIHIHPTLSEAVMEAALKTEGKAIHALN